MNSCVYYTRDREESQMEEDYIENDEDGNIFELIAEECYYDDLWLEEKEREEMDNGRE